jgi:hypothetical protein
MAGDRCGRSRDRTCHDARVFELSKAWLRLNPVAASQERLEHGGLARARRPDELEEVRTRPGALRDNTRHQ